MRNNVPGSSFQRRSIDRRRIRSRSRSPRRDRRNRSRSPSDSFNRNRSRCRSSPFSRFPRSRDRSRSRSRSRSATRSFRPPIQGPSHSPRPHRKNFLSPTRRSPQRNRANPRSTTEGNSRSSPPPPPPSPPRPEHDHWKPATTKDGKTYYYHVWTKDTSWENPQAQAGPTPPPPPHAPPPPLTQKVTINGDALQHGAKKEKVPPVYMLHTQCDLNGGALKKSSINEMVATSSAFLSRDISNANERIKRKIILTFPSQPSVLDDMDPPPGARKKAPALDSIDDSIPNTEARAKPKFEIRIPPRQLAVRPEPVCLQHIFRTGGCRSGGDCSRLHEVNSEVALKTLYGTKKLKGFPLDMDKCKALGVQFDMLPIELQRNNLDAKSKLEAPGRIREGTGEQGQKRKFPLTFPSQPSVLDDVDPSPRARKKAPALDSIDDSIPNTEARAKPKFEIRIPLHQVAIRPEPTCLHYVFKAGGCRYGGSCSRLHVVSSEVALKTLYATKSLKGFRLDIDKCKALGVRFDMLPIGIQRNNLDAKSKLEAPGRFREDTGELGGEVRNKIAIKEECNRFRQGKCKKGEACRYAHTRTASNSTSPNKYDLNQALSSSRRQPARPGSLSLPQHSSQALAANVRTSSSPDRLLKRPVSPSTSKSCPETTGQSFGEQANPASRAPPSSMDLDTPASSSAVFDTPRTKQLPLPISAPAHFKVQSPNRPPTPELD